MRSFLSFVVLASVATSATVFAATGDMAMPTLPPTTPSAMSSATTVTMNTGANALPPPSNALPEMKTTGMNAASTLVVASA